MFKKTYIAIIGNDEGQPIGSVVARGWFGTVHFGSITRPVVVTS